MLRRGRPTRRSRRWALILRICPFRRQGSSSRTHLRASERLPKQPPQRSSAVEDAWLSGVTVFTISARLDSIVAALTPAEATDPTGKVCVQTGTRTNTMTDEGLIIVEALTDVMRAASGITTGIPTTAKNTTTEDAMTATNGGTMKNPTSRGRFPSGFTITSIADQKVLAVPSAIKMMARSGELRHSKM